MKRISLIDVPDKYMHYNNYCLLILEGEMESCVWPLNSSFFQISPLILRHFTPMASCLYL